MKMGAAATGIAALVLIFTFQNCSKVSFTESPSEVPGIIGTVGDDSGPKKSLTFKADDSGYVCSPFGGGPVTSTSGLKAELRYIDSASALSQDAKSSVLSVKYFDDKTADIIKSAQPVYLPDINVPARLFNQGFTSSDGKTLKDNGGQVLIEFFALKMESVLKLSDQDLEGYYELATISDDSTVMEVMLNGVWTNIIANDGPHSTKMGCSNQKFLFTKATRLPIRYYYNQGPRTEISNVLVWNYRGTNPAADSSVISDATIRTYCNRSSGSEYWNPANSAEGVLFKDMKDNQGWKIIKSENFQLPDNEINPCAFNKYDLNPTLLASAVTDTNQSIRFKSTDSTIFSATLYKMDGTNKVLVKNIPQQAEDFIHDFETGNLDPLIQYRLEVEVSLPAKNLKVLRSYLLSFKEI